MDEKTRKEAFLSLARTLKSVSKACHMLGISRNTFYRAIKEKLEEENHGPKRRKYSDKTLAKMLEMENRVIEMWRNDPLLGKRAIAKRIQDTGVYISASGVYNILRRRESGKQVESIACTMENKPRLSKNHPSDRKPKTGADMLNSELYPM